MMTRWTLASMLVLAAADLSARSVPLFGADLEAQADDGLMESEETLIYSVRVKIGYGRSVFDDNLVRPSTANPLKLRYVVEPSCPNVGYIDMFLRSTTDGTWTQTRYDGGYDRHSLASFDAVRFEFHQTRYTSVTCELRLYGTSSSGGDPDWGNGVLAGGAEYTGGFAGNLEVAISAAERIKGFRLAVPEFCTGVEVLEAGTVTEGVFEAATLVDAEQRIYAVAGGQVRTGKVRFSLNGPFDARCYVPVFTYAAN